MIKSKLFNIIRSLNKNEIKEFREFVNSPFFNKEKVQIRLAEFLAESFPFKDERTAEKEYVFNFIYPGKKYNDGLMRNIISDALKLAEKFLVIKKLGRSSLKSELLLLEEFKERNIRSNFLKQKKAIESALENTAYKDSTYYEAKANVKRLYHSFLRETEDTFHTSHSVYEEAAEMFSASFLLNILFYNTYLINNRTYFTNDKINLIFSKEIDGFLESDGRHFLDIPEVRSGYYSFKLIETGDEKYFYGLKKLLSAGTWQLTPPARKDIQTILENYCYRKVTEGKAEFVREQFLIYKASIEEGTAKGAKGYISNVLFLSIIATGFESGEFEWTDNFIKNYIDQTKEESRNDIRYFSTALRAYWMQDLNLSLEALSKVKTEDFAFRHNIRSLMLKIYFDLNEAEPFYLHIDSYKHFILNNKLVHDKVREQVNNFINYSKRLFTLRNSSGVDTGFELESLRKEISDNQSLINKIWLLKKSREIT